MLSGAVKTGASTPLPRPGSVVAGAPQEVKVTPRRWRRAAEVAAACGEIVQASKCPGFAEEAGRRSCCQASRGLGPLPQPPWGRWAFLLTLQNPSWIPCPLSPKSRRLRLYNKSLFALIGQDGSCCSIRNWQPPAREPSQEGTPQGGEDISPVKGVTGRVRESLEVN